jgi:transcriptional regulator with XRE-family HTH domain
MHNRGLSYDREGTKGGDMIGQLIKQAREAAGLTQLQLCEKLGTHNRRVSAWERGADGVSLDKTKLLADTLHVPQATLITGVLQHWLEMAEIDYEVTVAKRKSPNVNAGEELKRMRMDKGVALRALARALQVSAPRIVDLERGQKLIKPETAWWYADALGVDHEEPVRLALQDAVNRECGNGFRVSINGK